MLPVVLGAKVIASFFYGLHDQVYYIGGAFMLIVALMALLGIKMPQPKLPWQPKQASDIWSTFTLGIFSGIFIHVDSLLIGFFVSVKEVGLYNTAAPIAGLLILLPSTKL